ncbi:putative protein kinase RLK-Pelle-L-LEC family [Helianthus annuus]|nr:putative protein kinase RLK-Pelle-L-LEC family [Helianthus annuus]
MPLPLQTFVTFLLVVNLLLSPPPTTAVDFLFNSFNDTTNLLLLRDARIEPPVIRLSNDSNQWSIGRAFYSTPIQILRPNSNNLTTFSTQFIFSILPEIPSSPGFGITFVLSNVTEPPGAVGGQYLGLFSNPATGAPAPLIAVEFDTGTNNEFNETNGNHVGIDLNNIESVEYVSAGYFNSNGSFVPVEMRNGQNVHVWIEFDGSRSEINVTIAPVGVSRPIRPLLTFWNPIIRNYVSPEMYVGFSASKTTWVEAQRVLAWSFSDTGVARDVNTTGLPVFRALESSSGLSTGAKVGIICGSVGFFLCLLGVCYYVWLKRYAGNDEVEVEDWEVDFWPHRYSYEELKAATNGFSDDHVLGAGGFGKVYKGTLSNETEVAVKCVNHDSKQGVKEFMAEISSMGRLQHKNLVQMRGWCRKGNELLLVYDYMPNGSLNNWIFDKPKSVLGWAGRKRVLVDVEMRGRLGDFGLAKLYTQGEVPGTTRVVGTLGYLAPELAMLASPTTASDVYSFGVVVLEVACGRKPIETWHDRDEDMILVDLVREKYVEGKLVELADKRIKGEYDVEDMEAVLKLGLSCCHPDPLHRPTMSEVVALLLGEDTTVTPRVMLQESKKEPSP